MFKSFALFMLFLIVGGSAARAFDQAAVTTFCAEPDRKIAAEGKQPDGKPADAALMELKPGKYTVADTGSIEIFEGGGFILNKPKNAITFRGTDGDDMMSPTALGGCSLGQLSEAMRRNNLTIPSAADLVK